MFVGVAYIALLQVVLNRGHSVEALCSHDSDCHCPDRNTQAKCVAIDGDGISGRVCVCNPVHSVEAVECKHDSDCHCQGDNFHARCLLNQTSGHGHYYCGRCYPVNCDSNPCPTGKICIAETFQTSNDIHFRCRDICSNVCSGTNTCITTHLSHECLDPCVPNPCSSTKTCVRKDRTPFYVCEAPNTDQTTSRPTDPTTTEATTTSSPKPTPAPPNSNCSEFDVTLHGCHDASVCILPHVLEVICPDPKEAKYCPTKCGCCPKVPLLG